MSIVPKIPLRREPEGPPEGFMRWMDPYMAMSGIIPQRYEFVETWNAFNGERHVIEPAKMHPAQNVACLYWRPVKAFGEEAH